MLQPFARASKTLADYTHIVGRPLIEEIRELAEPLKGRRVVHLSATAFGGGGPASCFFAGSSGDASLRKYLAFGLDGGFTMLWMCPLDESTKSIFPRRMFRYSQQACQAVLCSVTPAST